MKRDSLGKSGAFAFAAVAGLASCLSIGTARADTMVQIGLEPGGVGSPLTVVATANGPLGTFTGPCPCSGFDPVSVTGLVPGGPGPIPGSLALFSSNILAKLPATEPGSVLNIVVTATGVTVPLLQTLFSGYTSNNLINASAVADVRIDPTNTPLVNGLLEPPGVIVSQINFQGIGAETIQSPLPAIAPGQPYGVTEDFQITAGPDATAQLTTSTYSVPGPVVGAGLPGLIAALGGLVAMARRRRKQLI